MTMGRNNSMGDASRGTGGSDVTSQVRVGVRVRPLTSTERGVGGQPVITCDAFSNTVELTNRRFTYDTVFDSNVSQCQLYETVSTPLLKSFMEGYNATIIAYGQTGSGKTFTMGSEAHTDIDVTESTGLIPRFMKHLFQSLEEKKQQVGEGNGFNYQLQASFLEVYGEDIHDLLDKSRQSLPLRENENGGVVCSGLTAKNIDTAGQALQVLHEGTLNRTTAATLMNLTSSRSHAVFTVVLTQHETQQQNENHNPVEIASTSRFTFVDLAGSERMKKTGAEGERAKEGIKINEGLLALGNVINALADEERLQEGKKVHVPYRQSKLTRLLQDALGGNSQTLFLACVSPSDTNASETLSTLHYANRARNIRNAPTRNIDSAALELQRLHALTSVLKAELIKNKFGLESKSVTFDEDDDGVGVEDDTLMHRKDVNDYLNKIHSIAEKRMGFGNASGTASISTSNFQFAQPPTHKVDPTTILTSPRRNIMLRAHTPSMRIDSTPNKSILENFDPSLLGETNPDEEMAILDQLLDIQHHDQLFDTEKKRDSANLKLVEGELAEQEVLLLQLRESLKVYHNMKDKYETLMVEVQQLETEKSQLAEKLKESTADPTQGCSSDIKKQMDKVERNLVRARNETRKHREMYRKAELEAQKCRTLERKIAELKTSRANLIKKQKETAARHKEFTESKQREIIALKRKEKKNEKELSRLQRDVETHRRNLDKRTVYCNKLTGKLKQTEAHLMKLLSMRQRELRNRANTRSNVSNTQKAKRRKVESERGEEPLQHQNEEIFASESDEIDSICFVLSKAIQEKVLHAELKYQYEECLARYGGAMRSLVSSLKLLENSKTYDEDDDSMKDMKASIEELELKVEITGNELEKIRKELAKIENINEQESTPESSAKTAIQGKNAPTLRTVLLDIVDKLSDTEFQVKLLENKVHRKESVIESLESEVQDLNNNISVLKKEIFNLRNGSTSVDSTIRESLEREKVELQTKLDEIQSQFMSAKEAADNLRKERNELKSTLLEMQEKRIVAKVALQQQNGVHAPENILQEIQNIWRDLGLDPSGRGHFQAQIENCLEDTCSRKLVEVATVKSDTEEKIAAIRKEIRLMTESLNEKCDETKIGRCDGPLFEQLKELQKYRSSLQEQYSNAAERRQKLTKQVQDITTLLGLRSDFLAPELQRLLSETVMHVSEDEVLISKHNLSDSFLVACEHALTDLKVKKSQTIARNGEYQKECLQLVQEMKLSKDDYLSVVVHSTKRRNGRLPSWWSNDIAANVAAVTSTEGGVVQPTQKFSLHLAEFHESLRVISNTRRQFSDKLRGIIERAQKTLLATVDGEVDASEAYSSFHDALFRLPHLSKDRAYACMEEIKALNDGVDVMTQSEIEALTVVWEALSVSIKERGRFWGDVDTAVMEIQTEAAGPFDTIVQLSASDGEEWVLSAIKDATKSYRQLEARLLKLEFIHREVERLRTRQDAKSRIISLDSEIRIISAKLNEFEDKKCDKYRLTTKKDTSSSLLKEERFRKQMQSKFTSKVEQLKELLKAWKTTEGYTFDSNILSDEVRTILNSSPRNEFMHLRTVKYQSSTKRKVTIASRDDECIAPTPIKRAPLSAKKSAIKSIGRAPPFSASRRIRDSGKTERSLAKPTPSRVAIKDTKKRKSDEDMPLSDVRTSKSRRTPMKSSPTGVSKPSKGEQRNPLSPAPINTSQKKNIPGSVGTKRLTLDPFGLVLNQAFSPQVTDKENPSD